MQIIMGVLCLSFSATIIILQCMYCSSHANMTRNFIEIPSPVTVEVENGVEMDVVFRCRHQRRDANIGWLINGSSSRLHRDVVDGFILDSDDTRTDTLTIPAIPEYNGTEVVCAATFLGGSPDEVTPPANLIIIVTRKAATQPPPTTTIELVTREATTQPTPTTAMGPGFMMTPSSLNKTVEQGEADFSCQHRSSDDIIWRVNGTSIISSDNISESRVPVGDGHFVYFLSVAILPGFNNTTIECGAVFFDSFPLQFTPPVTLLVQDIPGNVSNLGCGRNYSSGVLTTFWEPLPTLDITDRDPDIIYRVQIFKTTCGLSVLMSDENVTESVTSNSLSPLELMEIYMAVITPRNNVPGYIDGPKEEMKEEFMPLRGMTLFELSTGQPKTVESIQPVPHYYMMVLESLDGIGNNLQINISVQRKREIVIMKIEEPLPPRRLWTALILPYSCEADMQVAELSTHEIQNITVNPSPPGAIQLNGVFVDGSGATGVLWIVCSLSIDSDIQYIYIAKQPGQSSISMNVTGLTGTEYGVSSFALENGVPFPRVVTLPTNIIVSVADNDNQETIPQPIDYLLHNTSTGVCVTCTFLESSTTDCVAVVHQRISQLSSSGLMNIESSHKFTRSDDTAYGCIEGVNLEQYQVGVIAVKVISPTIQSNDKGSSLSGAVAGIVLGITSFILIAVVLIEIVYYYLKKRWKVIKLGPLYSEVGIAPPRLQSDTVVNIEDDSGFHHYAESAVPLREEETGRDTSAEEQSPPLPPGLEESLVAPPLPPRLEESVILVEDQLLDTEARSPHESHDSIKGPPLPRGPPDQDTSKDGSSDPTYAQPELTRKIAVPPPAATEKLVYDDIHGFQNREGQTYALPQLHVPPCKKVVDDLHQVMYSEIQPKTQGEATSIEPDRTAVQAYQTGTPPTPCDHLTSDLLFSRLLHHASKWQSLGLALSLDEDRLDEIYTNNEREEDCLREMLELYMMRSDCNHSWGEVEAALDRIANGIQESDSSSNSRMIDGSTIFSSTIHTNTQDRSLSHVVDIRKTHRMPDTDTIIGAYTCRRRSLQLGVKSAEVAEEIHHSVDHIADFKSEPNLPYAQGSQTSTITPNDDGLSAANNDEGALRRVHLKTPSSPKCFHFAANSVELFVAIEGYREAKELLQHVPCQESLEAIIPDYKSTLIEQLGIGSLREKPSSMKEYHDSYQEENLDVHVDSHLDTISMSIKERKPSLQLLLEPLNKINLHESQRIFSSNRLQEVVSIQKFNCQAHEAPHLISQAIELLFCEQTMLSTFNLWTDLKHWLSKSWDKIYSYRYCLMKCSAAS